MQDEPDGLDDKATGTIQGVPNGVAQEESKGVPDAGRQDGEAAPIHPDAGPDQAKDI